MTRRLLKSKMPAKAVPNRAMSAKAEPVGETPVEVTRMPAREMLVGEARTPAIAIDLGAVKTQLAEVTHQGTQGQMLPSSSKMPGKLHIIKVMARGKTVTMTVTQPWRMPAIVGRRTQHMRGKWELGWETDTWHQMTHVSSLTESICQRSWWSKARWDPSVLGLRL